MLSGRAWRIRIPSQAHIADLALGAFFFAMRSCERTKSVPVLGRTKRVQMGCLVFRTASRRTEIGVKVQKTDDITLKSSPSIPEGEREILQGPDGPVLVTRLLLSMKKAKISVEDGTPTFTCTFQNSCFELECRANVRSG
jgi:hypothetical protein